MSQENDGQDVPYEESDDHDPAGFSQDAVYDTGILPIFRVSVTEAVKNGPSLQFTIMATRVDSSDGDRGLVVQRQFEDIEWLHHQLVTGNDTFGIIVPPLPAKPEFDPKAVESKTRKQLGSSCNILRPDDFDLECKAIHKYLSMMLAHPSFGRDKNLETFLLEKEAPVRAKVSKGIIGWLSTSIDAARKGQHKDIDDYFSRQRDWAADYLKASKEISTTFNRLTQNQWRLTSSLQHFATTLAQLLPYKDESFRTVNKLLLRLSHVIEGSRKDLESITLSDEKGLGLELDFLARHMESVKEMLFQRTCLMINLEDTSKALEKAKLQKRQTAEEAKQSAEVAYENCTKNAKAELKMYMRQRVLNVQEGLVAFTEAQIRTNRETYSKLEEALKDIQAEI